MPQFSAWKRVRCPTATALARVAPVALAVHAAPVALAALATLAACEDTPSDGAPDGGAGAPDGGGPAPDAGMPGPDASTLPGDWVPLVTAAWNLPAGEEGYVCASRTLSQDMIVGAIRPLNATGTHHTTVAVGEPTGPDDPGSPCGVGFGSFYASGVGTEALVLPEGVALVARAGQQVHLNLHLFNSTEAALAGTSGVEVQLVDAATVQHEARVSLDGPTGLAIPSTGQPHTISGENGLAAGETIIAIFPHMHQLGSHFKAEVLRGGGSLPLWDQPYQFESQEFSLVEPLVVQAGDTLRTTCTWINSTGATVFWGDSSEAEMCFSILMSY